jgi:hypothetical protein
MISVPFLPEFKERLLSGLKTATSRTKRLGRPGQCFTAFGMTFRLRAVKKWPLRWVADLMYHEEGFETPDQFKAIWKRIHPKRGYVETDLVWLHVFEKVKA